MQGKPKCTSEYIPSLVGASKEGSARRANVSRTLIRARANFRLDSALNAGDIANRNWTVVQRASLASTPSNYCSRSRDSRRGDERQRAAAH